MKSVWSIYYILLLYRRNYIKQDFLKLAKRSGITLLILINII